MGILYGRKSALVFSSNVFLFFFLPLVLAGYYLTPPRFRNAVLLLSSLLFYAWGEPVYLSLMLFTILVNYAFGRLIASQRQKGRSAKLSLVCGLILDLGLLAVFKYAGFFASSVNLLLGSNIPVPAIALPIGISFYIFQSMSYTIDVYRREVSVQKDLVDFGAYVSMFPQLIAGPIVRYRDIAAQLSSRHENFAQFSAGISLFILGLSKKVLLANPMGSLWEFVQTQNDPLAAWTGMFAYTFQIYFDFSGYSDMAIGLGKMFGFDFPINFNYPYISSSVTEFWRRWHISLSTWFREYVYIPLGGNRKGLKRQILNLLIVWSLTGLWHGASWNFLFWGLYYSVLLILEKLFLQKLLSKVPLLFRRILLFLTVSLGWMLFYFEDLGVLFAFLKRLFLPVSPDPYTISYVLAYLPTLLAALLCATPLLARLYERARGKALAEWARWIVLAALFVLCISSLATQSYNPFIYFRF